MGRCPHAGMRLGLWPMGGGVLFQIEVNEFVDSEYGN